MNLTSQIGGLEGDENCTSFTQSVINWATFGVPILHPDGSISYVHFIELDCEDKCNWLANLTNNNYAGKKSFDFDVEYSELFGLDEVKIKFKFYDGNIELLIDSEFESSDVEISLLSLQGRSLFVLDEVLRKGSNSYTLPTDEFAIGIYLIMVKINNIYLKSYPYFKVK